MREIRQTAENLDKNIQRLRAAKIENDKNYELINIDLNNQQPIQMQRPSEAHNGFGSSFRPQKQPIISQQHNFQYNDHELMMI